MKFLDRVLLVLPSMLMGMSLTSGLVRLDPTNLGKTSPSFHFMMVGLWGVVVLARLFVESQKDA